MKALILSDSHGSFERVWGVFKSEVFDAVIFLGDGLRDAQRLYSLSGPVPVYTVCGNCDFLMSGVPDMQVLELVGKRVMITHGHRFGVKNGLSELKRTAAYERADAVLFGHTHKRFFDTAEGLLILNPGSAANGSYAVMTVDDGIEFEFKEDI